MAHEEGCVAQTSNNSVPMCSPLGVMGNTPSRFRHWTPFFDTQAGRHGWTEDSLRAEWEAAK